MTAFTAMGDGPGFTGHATDAASGLTYMQQRYYDPIAMRFLSVDPVVNGVSLYAYARNNPFRFVDPDGRYARGEGFNDRQWGQFKRAQKAQARKVDSAKSRLDAALADPKKFASAVSGYEKVFGKGSGTRENMAATSSLLGKISGALRDDGTKGFTAQGHNQAGMDALKGKAMNGVAALGENPGNEIHINLSHSNFTSGNVTLFGRTLGHEASHNFGTSDQKIDGISAYYDGDARQQDAYDRLPGESPEKAVINPDTIMEYVR